MLSVQMEQWVNLKFLVKLGKTFTEAYAMLKEVYGNEYLSRTQVFELFKRFKEKRLWRPSMCGGPRGSPPRLPVHPALPNIRTRNINDLITA
ncbi:hypothetical protein NQ318_002846 [Aromia moschata]|uniref:Mos1 transposase HTH domain-containing protein n=1 Tax=Aromia moschata TaxID=1265417 RepID=A0AAV8XUD4_9CUCU|nr:hypothetical protein NQ318_002846 [Aromia moschata]